MRIIAVVTSGKAFADWAQRQPSLLSRSRNIAVGKEWIAHRIDSFDVPWQGGVHEVVLLPSHGEFVETPRALLPREFEKAA